MEGESCQRAKKLKLAFKKAITETFKDKNAIREAVLCKKSIGKDSLSFVNEDPEEEGDYTEYNNQKLEELFEKFRYNSYDIFRSKLSESGVSEKLEGLEKMIKENRVNLRDIKSADYIQEIYESHIVEKKLDFYNKVEKATLRARERKNKVRVQNEKLSSELEELEKENEYLEQRFRVLVDRLGGFLRK